MPMRSTTHTWWTTLAGCGSLALAIANGYAQVPTPIPDAPAAEAPAAEATADTPAEAKVSLTEITADSLEYDMKNRLAKLIGAVKVVDREMTIVADRMRVEFDENNDVTALEAEGNVRILRGDIRATGGRATYDVAVGLLTLTEEPVLYQTNTKMTGALKVLYNRNEERAWNEGVQPGQQLKIVHIRSGEDDGGFDLLGPKKEKPANGPTETPPDPAGKAKGE